MHKDISLLEFVTFFLRHLKTLSIHFVIAVVAAVAISLVLPKTFESALVFLPPGSGESGLSALIGGKFDLDILGGSKLSKRQYMTILNSRELREDLIRKFDLVNVYELAKSPCPMDMALRRLKRQVSILDEVEGGLGISDIVSVELRVRDKSPKRASEMANYLFRSMEAKSMDLSKIEYERMLGFLRAQGQECDTTLAIARRQLKEFQIANKIYDVSSQVSMAMEAVGRTQAELLTLQKQQAFLGRHSTRESGELREIDERIEILKAKGSELENKMTVDVIPGLKLSLTLAGNYVDLLKEVETYVQVRAVLRQQEEMAKIRSSVNYSPVALVDAARPAEWKLKPRRSFVVIGVVSFYFCVLVSFLFARERYLHLKQTAPDKLAAIRRALRPSRSV